MKLRSKRRQRLCWWVLIGLCMGAHAWAGLKVLPPPGPDAAKTGSDSRRLLVGTRPGGTSEKAKAEYIRIKTEQLKVLAGMDAAGGQLALVADVLANAKEPLEIRVPAAELVQAVVSDWAIPSPDIDRTAEALLAVVQEHHAALKSDKANARISASDYAMMMPAVMAALDRISIQPASAMTKAKVKSVVDRVAAAERARLLSVVQEVEKTILAGKVDKPYQLARLTYDVDAELRKVMQSEFFTDDHRAAILGFVEKLQADTPLRYRKGEYATQLWGNVISMLGDLGGERALKCLKKLEADPTIGMKPQILAATRTIEAGLKE